MCCGGVLYLHEKAGAPHYVSPLYDFGPPTRGFPHDIYPPLHALMPDP
jgi:hypothetical protein